MRRPLAAGLLILALPGCGSRGTGARTSAQSTSSPPAAKAALRKAAATAKAAEDKAPPGASPTLRAIYATFPAPKPDPEAKRSAAAIKAGERACRGKAPVQVKHEFYAAAKPKLAPEQTKMIDRIAGFESHSSTDASFIAGQLAADVYQATLSAASGQYGYQGCIYSLAQRLEHRLAPKR